MGWIQEFSHLCVEFRNSLIYGLNSGVLSFMGWIQEFSHLWVEFRNSLINGLNSGILSLKGWIQEFSHLWVKFRNSLINGLNSGILSFMGWIQEFSHLWVEFKSIWFFVAAVAMWPSRRVRITHRGWHKCSLSQVSVTACTGWLWISLTAVSVLTVCLVWSGLVCHVLVSTP